MLDENKFTVSLDSSGYSLHKRGYKVSSVDAPINEVLAAGLILLSDWNQVSNFHDPMCGSGTILIEAAMTQIIFLQIYFVNVLDLKDGKILTQIYGKKLEIFL